MVRERMKDEERERVKERTAMPPTPKSWLSPMTNISLQYSGRK